MHKLYILVLTVAFVTAVRSANSPAWMEVPKEIQVLRLPWISKSMTHAMCAKHFPDLAAKYSSTIPAHQAEVRRAEAMVRKDAADQGANGQRYLAAYMKEAQQTLDRTIKEAASVPPPTEMECQSVLSVVARADNLFNMWRFFARQMQEQESSAARSRKGVN
jgi:hypothetical protein